MQTLPGHLSDLRVVPLHISSVQEMYEDSIEFSLSSADKGAVGFIPAQELAILTQVYD